MEEMKLTRYYFFFQAFIYLLWSETSITDVKGSVALENLFPEGEEPRQLETHLPTFSTSLYVAIGKRKSSRHWGRKQYVRRMEKICKASLSRF